MDDQTPDEIDVYCPVCKQVARYVHLYDSRVGSRPGTRLYDDPTFECTGCGTIRGGLVDE